MDCGYYGLSSGTSGHCKTNALDPSLDWCRNYAHSHTNAIAFSWAQLYDNWFNWQGHCMIFFDSTVTICPSGVTWYANHGLGDTETFVRNGSCGSATGTWYSEYIIDLTGISVWKLFYIDFV